MRNLFIKKTFLVLVGLLMVVSLLAAPGGTNTVDAEGGNSSYYLPAVVNNSPLASADMVFFGANATWKFFDKGTVPGAGWNLPGFNDSAWGAGSAPLGYGNGTERTVVSYGSNADQKYPTTYFRKVFNIAPGSGFSSLSIDLTRDDSAIVYINGKEVLRSNMPSGTVGNETLAPGCSEGAVTAKIDPRSLVIGDNTIAVEVHQCNVSSSDIAFGAVLHGVYDPKYPLGTAVPTAAPTTAPTAVPTTAPTTAPTAAPTTAPTAVPTAVQTTVPTAVPTTAPTAQPTVAPTTPPTSGNTFYAAPNGSSSNDGSSGRPWSLSYALGQPSAVRPGDTIWVSSGTYSGTLILRLKGTADKPITVRALPGHRVTLRNTSSSPALDIQDTYYVNLVGMEVTSTYSSRSTSRHEQTYGIRVAQGASSHHVNMINMVVHDVQAQGIGWWQALQDSEIYGSLFYFNGTTQLDHGVYFHNVSGTKRFIDNIVNDNASHGFHGYAETDEKGLNYIHMEGNTFFNNGSVGYVTTKSQYGIYKRNILVGGKTISKNPVITNNYTYYPGSTGTSLNLGYSVGSSNARITNNYLMGGDFVLGGTNSGLTMTGNTVYAPAGMSGFSKSSFTNNSWLSSKPTGLQVFVRPNKYEANRANITIYNWNKASTVSVSGASLGGVALRPGDRYELHNAQNFYGDVVTGTYDGSAINVPMTGRSVAQPVGLNFKPASSFPEFGAFVLIVLGQ